MSPCMSGVPPHERGAQALGGTAVLLTTGYVKALRNIIPTKTSQYLPPEPYASDHTLSYYWKLNLCFRILTFMTMLERTGSEKVLLPL